LLVVHPTADNLRLLDQLIRQGIFPVADVHLLGVYHQDETYDYEKSSAYIREKNLLNMSLTEVTGALDPDDVRRKNSCTGQFRHLFAISRGALFFGGPDIPPVLYREPVHLLTLVTDPYRHLFEVSFLYHLLVRAGDPDRDPLLASRRDYLVSGICLGMQTMHVATGGTLVQDLPTEIYGAWTAEDVLSLSPHQQHRSYRGHLWNMRGEPTSYHFHPIVVQEGSFLDFGTSGREDGPMVLSSHHQGIEQPGSAWKIAAVSVDGKVIEAIQHLLYPHVFGVQFHPEKPGLFNPASLHQDASGDSVSFEQVIRGTSSYDFHLKYWQRVAAPLVPGE